MEKLFLTTVSFTGYNRRLKKCFFEDKPLMRKECEKRIMEICHTAIVHEIRHYECKLMNVEEITKPIINGFVMVTEEDEK